MNKETSIFKIQKKIVSGYSKIFLDTDILFEAPLPQEPKIIVANHPTTTDPFFLSLITDEPISIPVTGMAFEVPVFGRILYAAGHIPVNKTTSNGQSVVQQAVDKLSAGKTIGIFPEGSLSPTIGEFCRAKTGAARMALLSGVPVIPVGIYLNRDAYYEKEIKTENFTQTGRFAYCGKYTMTIGKPIRFSGSVEDDHFVRSVTEQIMESIIQQTNKSCRRMMMENQSSEQKPMIRRLQRIFRFS